MVTAARRRVLVADASKWGQRHLGRIGALADFDTLVTAGDPAAVEALRAVAAVAGTRVEVPDVLG